jgi:hypothetical protein
VYKRHSPIQEIAAQFSFIKTVPTFLKGLKLKSRLFSSLSQARRIFVGGASMLLCKRVETLIIYASGVCCHGIQSFQNVSDHIVFAYVHTALNPA